MAQEDEVTFLAKPIVGREAWVATRGEVTKTAVVTSVGSAKCMGITKF
jgi:hypothetical protein